jgi:hypothetical protein
MRPCGSDAAAGVLTSQEKILSPAAAARIRAAERPTRPPASPLLWRHRRFFGALALILMATPLAVGLVAPDSTALIMSEGRRFAPAPAAPTTLADWLALPAETDAYLKDHFGLRHAMIRAQVDLTKPMLGFGGAQSQFLVGRDGRLFYLGDDLVRQSAGLVLHDERVTDTAAFIAEMRDRLAVRGIRLIVAPPPNSATIYQDDLPVWAQKGSRTTEYDLFLRELAEQRVQAVDLRPVLQAVRARHEAYLVHDSHWTPRGAIAAFNAVAEAAGHEDWALDPAASLSPPTLRPGGDIARFLGVDSAVSEEVEEFNLPTGETEAYLSPQPMPDHVQVSGRPGATVMVIGDSFTTDFFTTMLIQHVGRVIWLNHQRCAFDWKWIDRYRPDEVWWMPTERFLTCKPGARPTDFARQ